jgi:hypothetical protein
VPPLFQCLYDSIELLIIRGLFLFHLIQLLTEVCYRSVFLTQDYSDCKSACIAFHLKCFLKIRQHQNWLFCNLPFQQFEALLSLISLVKRFMPLLHGVHHRCANSTEIPDEFLVETSQSMKTSHLKYILRRWPILNHFHLIWIHSQLIC